MNTRRFFGHTLLASTIAAALLSFSVTPVTAADSMAKTAATATNCRALCLRVA